MKTAPHPRAIDPALWVAIADERRPKLQQTTEWFDGTTHPVRVGWYERHFTDSMIDHSNASMHYWDGTFWRNSPGGIAHWRQVGDYPTWRGLVEQAGAADNSKESKQ